MTSENSDIVGENYVVVRTSESEVLVGFIKEVNGKWVTLNNAQRVLKWQVAGSSATFNGLATNGIINSESILSESSNTTMLNTAVEILFCSDSAKQSFVSHVNSVPVSYNESVLTELVMEGIVEKLIA